MRPVAVPSIWTLLVLLTVTASPRLAAAAPSPLSLQDVLPSAKGRSAEAQRLLEAPETLENQLEVGLANLDALKMRVFLVDPSVVLDACVDEALAMERIHRTHADLASRRRLLIAYYRIFQTLHAFESPAERRRLCDKAQEIERLSAGSTAEARATSDRSVAGLFEKSLDAYRRSRHHTPGATGRLGRQLIVPLGHEILASAPGNVETRLLLGTVLAATGEYDKAVEVMQKAAHLDRSGQVMMAIAEALHGAGKKDDAASYFDMARIQNASLSVPIEAFLKHAEAEAGVERFGKLVREDPKNVAHQIGLARAYVGLGQHDEAFQTLKPCVESDPANAEPIGLLLKVGTESRDPAPILEFLSNLKTSALSTSRDLQATYYALILRHVSRSIAAGVPGAYEAYAPRLRSLERRVLRRNASARIEAGILLQLLQVLAHAKEPGQALRHLRDLDLRAKRYAAEQDIETDFALHLRAVLEYVGHRPATRTASRFLRDAAHRSAPARFDLTQASILRGLLRHDKKVLEDAEWNLSQLESVRTAASWERAYTEACIQLAKHVLDPAGEKKALAAAKKSLASLLLQRVQLGIPPEYVALIRVNLSYAYLAEDDAEAVTRTLDEEKIKDLTAPALRVRAAETLAVALERKGQKLRATAVRRLAGTSSASPATTSVQCILRYGQEVLRFDGVPTTPVGRWIASELSGTPGLVAATRRSAEALRSVWFTVAPELTISEPERAHHLVEVRLRLTLAFHAPLPVGK